MKLEFWLDYLSPICYKQHQAIELLFKKYKFNDLELLYRSYEMIPNFEPLEDCTFYRILSNHHVLTIEETQQMFKNLPDDIKPVKVIDAHRLSHLAKKSEKAFEFNQMVFHYYYDLKKDISRKEILKEIASSVGLNQDEVDQVLESDKYLDSVSLNRENAIVKGIFEVPHMRIDGKIRLKNYHSDDQIIEALNIAAASYSKTDYCEDENCQRKKTR
ncbi:MAG: DsbA family protein [Acholeplasmataceae bacterium]|nr:DsbA family protein [Acholeplasmataceae bacterium]